MSFITKLSKIIGTTTSSKTSSAATSSRSIAKDRLSVILASQRGSELLDGVNMDILQRDVLEVVQVGNIIIRVLSEYTFPLNGSLIYQICVTEAYTSSR